ncbi:VCBS repeat-containing protein, partial [candidate division WOR-3 bacterium]|nr:VCBS repeat-containing protein [candidate division WOR-3 bacterium]
MKKLILIIIFIITILTLQSREFVFLQELEHGTVEPKRMAGPLFHDFDRDGKDELIMWTFIADSSFLRFYEYQYNYHLELIKTNYYKSHMWTAGIGDFDNDGLYEILGGDPDSNFLYLMEQSDSFDYPDSITWHSDTIFNTFKYVMSTNRLKPDSIDRISGLGVPIISTSVYGMGFYYYECNGDNSYYMKTFAESTKFCTSNFDIGDYNDNGIVEIFAELIDGANIVRYEASDVSADSFILID